MNNRLLKREFQQSAGGIWVTPDKLFAPDQKTIHIPSEKETQHYTKRFNRNPDERPKVTNINDYKPKRESDFDEAANDKTHEMAKQATAAVTSSHTRWQDQRLMEELAMAMREEIEKIRSQTVQTLRPKKPLSEVDISTITANMCRQHRI